MQDFVFFLGRFHVLALHVPIAMVIIAVLVDWLSRSPSRARLAAASPFLWGMTAVSAVLTVVLGYMHFAEGGFSGASASVHRLTGTLVAIACVAIWAVRTRRPRLCRRVDVPGGIALLALVVLTGHYGGSLTHGSEYLFEYAPPPLRSLAGLGERQAPPTGSLSPAQIVSADPATVDALVGAGFLVRQVSQSDPRLVVSPRASGSPVEADQLAVLSAAAESIASLDLRSTGLTDADLGGFDAFTELRQLQLGNNSLTDVGVASLGELMQLELLNLYGNPGIGDASIESLQALENLQSVYLWGTAVSAQAAARLRAARPDLKVDIGE